MSGYFAVERSCVSGQRCRAWERGARGYFRLHPAHAGSGRREKNHNSSPGTLQQRWVVVQPRWAPAGMGTAASAPGRTAIPAAAPRPRVQSTRGPAPANRFISTGRYLHESHLLIHNVEGSDGQTQDRPRCLGQLVKIFVKKQTAAIGLSPPTPAATNVLLRAPSSLPPKPPADKLTSCVVQQQQMSSTGCRGDWKSLCF